VNTKEYANDKFVIVDAGYHVLLDSALLKQEYPQEIVFTGGKKSDNNNNTTNSNASNRVHLAGRLCDTYDVFPVSKASQLNNAELNKYVLFYNVGAYSIVFNMPFHCQTKPPVVMKSNGQYVMVRKATTIEHLFAEEGGSL
jgi:diaminopimelate decarboxylase